MQQQRIPKNLREVEDTLEFLAAISKGCERKKCRYGGKRCNSFCVNSKALCHIRLAAELNPALDRMRKFLAGRKFREEEIAVAARDAISTLKAQISQQQLIAKTDYQWVK